MFVWCMILTPNTIIERIKKQFPFIEVSVTNFNEESATLHFSFGELEGKDVCFDCIFLLKKRERDYQIININ